MIRGLLTNLRAVDSSDLDRIAAWLDDPELMRWWGYGAAAVSRSTAARRLESWLGEESIWDHPIAFIVETLDGEACGLIVLSDLSAIDRCCELSILLEEHARRKGIGSDALDAVVDAAFHQWNLHRIAIRTEAHNAGAQEFFASNGFVEEGRLREARFLDGSWHDVLIYGQVQKDEDHI